MRQSGVAGWLRANLFSSLTNTVLTLLGVRAGRLDRAADHPLGASSMRSGSASDREACLTSPEGACWAFVKARIGQFMYGRYPIDERWRVDLTAILLLVGLVPMAIPKVPYKRETILYLLLSSRSSRSSC